jgi:hypothetical protein
MKKAILSAWKQLINYTTDPTQKLIPDELRIALTNPRHRHSIDLLSILGSWGDTMNDREIHEFLMELNAGRPLLNPLRSDAHNLIVDALSMRSIVTFRYRRK